jgi:flagellar hook-associated protein 2
LASALETALNGSDALRSAGRSVQVGFDDAGGLTFTSNRFGSESNVSITSVTDVSSNGTNLSVASGTAGTDVQGTINGRAAEGDGQVLFLSNSDGGGAAGLQVRIAGGTIGDRGSVSFIEGISERAVDAITSILGENGSLDSRTNNLNRDLERIQQDQVDLERRIESYRERLVSQFSAADSLIAQLNSTRDYITQQFAGLSAQGNNRG